ncbi:putative nicotianamine synthase 4 [Triticum urartu]|uniref:Nicotianamine synthase n=1 Tax=Triticum urartu TaxID=4572 RepID=M8A0B1_TRIUA|nr:putative nicotianamine synthase 4 [Triticum urartu]
MDAQNKEVDALVQKITGLHAAIAKLPSLSPCPAVDALFTDLVTACVPPSPVDVTELGPEAQAMREGLIRLCSEAEGKLEAHYSDMLAAFDNPLDHLGVFPYLLQQLGQPQQARDKAKVIAHLGAHMADGAALVVRSAHGARGFLYPIVDPQDIGRGGFEVLAVCHPDDDVVNSVIIAQKTNDVHEYGLGNGRGGRYARGTVPVVSPPCRFGEMVADVTQKREEFANAELAF